MNKFLLAAAVLGISLFFGQAARADGSCYGRYYSYSPVVIDSHSGHHHHHPVDLQPSIWLDTSCHGDHYHYNYRPVIVEDRCYAPSYRAYYPSGVGVSTGRASFWFGF